MTLEDEDMRSSPLTMADFRQISRSAHAFWNMPLTNPCHKDSGCKALVVSNGTLELSCGECSKLLGVIKIAATRPKGKVVDRCEAWLQKHSIERSDGDLLVPTTRSTAILLSEALPDLLGDNQ